MRTRGANWSYKETITLINIWSYANVQDEFKKSRRNANIYEKIAKKMVEPGYERNVKHKHLFKKYDIVYQK